MNKVLVYRGETYITCEELITFLLEYLSGELAAERRKEFDRHLSICDSCVAYLETYRQTIALGRAAVAEPAGAPPPELAAELVRAILAARK